MYTTCSTPHNPSRFFFNDSPNEACKPSLLPPARNVWKYCCGDSNAFKADSFENIGELSAFFIWVNMLILEEAKGKEVNIAIPLIKSRDILCIILWLKVTLNSNKKLINSEDNDRWMI